MKIVQLVPSFSYGDAVGNEVVAFYEIIKKLGLETCVYAEDIDVRLREKVEARSYHDIPVMDDEDVLIYHFAAGWNPLPEVLDKVCCRRIMIFHNITPSRFFKGYNRNAYISCSYGIEQLKKYISSFDYCVTHSKFSKSDIESLNTNIPVKSIPLLIDLSDFDQKPDADVINKYDDDWTNLLFVGRFAPNKCQHDIIECFKRYKEDYNKKARLILVGSPADSSYFGYVKECAKMSGVNDDIIFPGHIPFSHILSYYRLADLFLCLSEHEGFCVPVLEAMKMKVPFLGFSSCAVPETMGRAGVLIKEKDFGTIAEMINDLMENPKKRREIVKGQEMRLQDFSYKKIAEEYVKLFTKWLHKGNKK